MMRYCPFAGGLGCGQLTVTDVEDVLVSVCCLHLEQQGAAPTRYPEVVTECVVTGMAA